MQLKDIKTLQQISKEYNIPSTTLRQRLILESFNLVEGKDYIRLGKGQSIIFSPNGVIKIVKHVH